MHIFTTFMSVNASLFYFEQNEQNLIVLKSLFDYLNY